MDENNNIETDQQENSEVSTIDTPDFDIEAYRKNLTVQETSEKELEYQQLIKDQNDLINKYREEIANLKSTNLKLASTTSPNTTLTETADDIFRNMLK